LDCRRHIYDGHQLQLRHQVHDLPFWLLHVARVRVQVCLSSFTSFELPQYTSASNGDIQILKVLWFHRSPRQSRFQTTQESRPHWGEAETATHCRFSPRQLTCQSPSKESNKLRDLLDGSAARTTLRNRFEGTLVSIKGLSTFVRQSCDLLLGETDKWKRFERSSRRAPHSSCFEYEKAAARASAYDLRSSASFLWIRGEDICGPSSGKRKHTNAGVRTKSKQALVLKISVELSRWPGIWPYRHWSRG